MHRSDPALLNFSWAWNGPRLEIHRYVTLTLDGQCIYTSFDLNLDQAFQHLLI